MRFLPHIVSALLLIVGCSDNTATVVLVNKSGTILDSVRIGLSSRTEVRYVGSLQPESTATVEFRGFSDAAYVVNCRLSDNKAFSETLGYVTNGLSFRDTLTFKVDSLSTIRLQYSLATVPS